MTTSSITSSALSSGRLREALGRDNVVAPHTLDEGVLKPLEHSALENNAPAGAILSSAADLTKWILTLVNKGVMPNGKRLLSEAQIRTLWTPLIFERFTHNPKLTGTLEHWQYDTLVARWKDRSLLADAYVSFQLNAEAKIERIAMKAVSPLTDFSFDFHDLSLTPIPSEARGWD